VICFPIPDCYYPESKLKLSTAEGSELVRKLAVVIYADKLFADLPILADALEDHGCTDTDLLTHLRGPGPHVRGCWALDLVLGKE
jgi:hypothetical protein